MNLSVVRNNWKKFTFGTLALGYGVHSLKSYHDIGQHMRSVCTSIVEHAEKTNTTEDPKRILVVLNPVANNKKAEKTFHKYCEPMLHLAGYYVEIFKTNHVGHAKSYIEFMDVLPDAIVIAGGDGTSSEVVTGLMRRNASCPMVVLPLGRTNETSYKIADVQPINQTLENVKFLTNTLLAMIHGHLQNAAVVKYNVIDQSTDNSSLEKKNLKPIYGLSRFSWGVLQDLEEIKDKYWYFGIFRNYAAIVFNSFSSSLNWAFSTNYTYTPPCAGCRNCYEERKKPLPSSYLRKFLSSTKDVGDPKSNVINENCNTKTEGHIDEINQLNITYTRSHDVNYQLETEFIKTLTPGLNIIKHMNDVAKNKIPASITLKCRTIQLSPTTALEKANYFIDGEEYDVRPVEVSLVPNAIKVFSWKSSQM